MLVIFGVMLTSHLGTWLLHVSKGETAVVAVAAALLLAAFVVAIRATPFAVHAKPVDAESTRHLGLALLSDYLVPFEVASILMLAVMIGAAYLARRRPKDDA